MPLISVVIPAFNSSATLRRCLVALRAEEAGAARLHEIIVVDDFSTEDLAPIAAQFGARHERLDRQSGPARARNRGAQLASGDVVWFLDADLEPTPGALALVERHFREDPARAAAVGSYDADPSHLSAISQFKNLFHHYVHQRAGEFVSSFWSGCGAVRRDVFLSVAGFDETYWRRPMIEDIHLGYVLGRAGHRIRMIKELQVKHHKRWTFWGLIKTDIFDRAVPWTVILLQNRGQGGGELNLGGSYRFSVVAVYLALLALAAAVVSPWFFIAAAALLAASLGPHRDLIGFFARVRGPWFALRCVPLVWLYFFYCGVGLVLGIGAYFLERSRGETAFKDRAPGLEPANRAVEDR